MPTARIASSSSSTARSRCSSHAGKSAPDISAMRFTDFTLSTGMIPGITGVVTPCSREVAEELEPHVGLEEELRDAEVGARELLGLAPPVGRAIGRRGMTFGVHRDADREIADAAHEIDEIGRVVEIAGREVEVLGRIAAERQDVLDARVAVARHDLGRAPRACAPRT